MTDDAQIPAGAAPRGKLWNREYMKGMACNFMLFFAFYLLTPLLASSSAGASTKTDRAPITE